MKSWPEVAIPPLSSSYSLRRLQLFDSSSQSVKAIHAKNEYRMYVCGITPYDATHLGHAATYLTFDLVNRYLRATGSVVHFVENITDVDDPLLERAERDGVDWQELAHSQIELFRGDMVALHILPPEHYIGAIEAISLVIEAIQTLYKNGTIYKVDNDFYFKVRSDPNFGKHSHLSQDQMLEIFSQRGGDPHREGKKDPLDALVWMGRRGNDPYWESAFGAGRPGWHIECCAIALKYLNPHPLDPTSIDIQGGGSDLIFPHHEMSANQARSINGKEFASHYVHAGMIGLDDQKMSKSLGNLVFVSKLIAQGIDPMAIKCALFESHYRSDRMWSDDVLSRAVSRLDAIKIALSRPEVAPTSSVISAIADALSHDLDTPAVLAILDEWVHATSQGETGGSAGELSRALDTLLGLAL